jgi:hypothetical protein
MEVHHTHHPTHKKKWSEYIIEFVMLFAAVTLGFFAENVREHQVVIERKNQNLEAMIEDLRSDSVQIEERTKEYLAGMQILEELKLASLEYQQKKMTENDYINYIIHKNENIMVGISLFINNAAYKNTISTGSLSVIESKEIKQLIAEYYEELGLKLLDNNRNLDAEINEYIQETQMLISFDSEYRKSIAKIQHNELMNDFKTIPKFRKSILDPTFRLYIHKLEYRCEYYLYLLDRFKKVNKNLLNALENKNIKGNTSAPRFKS